MKDVAELLTGIGNLSGLLWPIVLLVIAIMFRRDLSAFLSRLMKAEVLGHKLELAENLDRLQKSVDVAANRTSQELQGKIQISQDTVSNLNATNEKNDYVKHVSQEIDDANKIEMSILKDAARSPKAALIALGATIEKEFRVLSACLGHPEIGTKPIRSAIRELQRKFPGTLPDVLSSLDMFWDVRNSVVHGGDYNDDYILRAIDVGLNLLRLLRNAPHERIEVLHHDIPVYSDEECYTPIEGVRAVILKITSSDGGSFRLGTFPTTKEDYHVGNVLTWEWDINRVWNRAWCRDPKDGRPREAWSSAGEFIGRNIETV